MGKGLPREEGGLKPKKESREYQYVPNTFRPKKH